MEFIRKEKPRIGVMAIGLRNYWTQFEGMKETVLNSHSKVVSLLSNRGEIFEGGLIDNAESSRKAGESFRQQNIDILFVHITTYSNSETLLPAARNLAVPIILLNVQPVKALDMQQIKTLGDWLSTGVTPAALPEMTNGLLRLGKQFDTITGHLDEDAILDQELDSWCKIAALLRRMKTQHMALIGRPFAGMMDLSLDETKLFSQFGTFVHHFEWDDLIAEQEIISPSDQQESVDTLQKDFALSSNVLPDAELRDIANVLAGARNFVQKNQICSISSHYEGAVPSKHLKLLGALNPVLSILNLHGVACPAEADMKVAMAMLILKSIAGSANLAELYSMDFNNDIVIIGHGGAGDPGFSQRPPKLTMTDTFHGKSGKGYTIQFYPDPGKVTLLALTQSRDGNFMMVASGGEVVPGPVLELGDTNGRVKFPQGLRKFIHDWSAYGPSHHGVIGYGHHIDTLHKVAIALNIPLFVV